MKRIEYEIIESLTIGCWVGYSWWDCCQVKEIHTETGTSGQYILIEDDKGNTMNVSFRLFSKYGRL